MTIFDVKQVVSNDLFFAVVLNDSGFINCKQTVFKLVTDLIDLVSDERFKVRLMNLKFRYN